MIPSAQTEDEQIDQSREDIAKAYAAVIAAILVGVKLSKVIAAQGDVQKIMVALGLDQASLSAVLEAIRENFLASGQIIAPQARIVFDVRNPAAEQWLKDESSTLVTRITESQREAIRVTLEEAMSRGINPRTTALDLIGRVGVNGKRVGGIVGLTGQQAGFVSNARAELSDLQQVANYFTRSRRDRRFDRTIMKAAREGKPLRQDFIARVVGRYADRLLQTRGEAIARTESITAFNAARQIAFEQARDGGKAVNVTRVWDAVGDSRTRHLHMLLDGQRRKLDEPFVDAQGNRMNYPGDTSLGALSDTTIMCRCRLRYKIDRFANLA